MKIFLFGKLNNENLERKIDIFLGENGLWMKKKTVI